MELSKIPESIFQMSKKEIQAKVKEASEKELEGGFVEPLKVYAFSKKAQEFFKSLEENFKEAAFNEAAKENRKSFEKFDSKIEVCAVYTAYDFKSCGDEEYNDLVKQKEEIESKIKEREKFLKALTKPLPIVTADGEVITINPPVVTKKDGLKITY